MRQKFKLTLLIYTIVRITLTIATNSPLQEDSEDRKSIPNLWLSDTKPNTQLAENQNLQLLLKRIGPNMRASADYHDYLDIHLNESILAWRNLHQQTRLFAKDRVRYYGPKLQQFLTESNVSHSCQNASMQVLDSIQSLDSKAVQMWSYAGSFPPIGLFDGHFTDMGSYQGCVNLGNKPSDNLTELHTSYCLLSFRPIVTSRRPFHRIFEQEDEKLLSQFVQSDIFSDLAKFAQYFHYVYLQTGVCVPYDCSAEDMQLIASSIASRLFLMAGPVKCFTRAPEANLKPENEIKVYEIENEPIMVAIDRTMNVKQIVALSIIGGFYGIVVISTLWHLFELFAKCGQDSTSKAESDVNGKSIEYSALKHIAFDYMSIITNGKEFLDASMKRNEIKCLHGFRVITMVWIICVHTLQYNQWAGFTRIFENVTLLQNPLAHPIYNANYVVDNFFLMSGLLASYSTWFNNKGTSINFSILTSLVGRYLRLTPQVFLVSLLYIILPLAAHGPFWFDMTHYAAKFCEKNWWVNLIHLQAFYRDDEMCNLVGWWISVDVFYYILALGLLWMILNKQQGRALLSTFLLVGTCISISAYRHFTGGYTPNNLGVVPQVAETWTKYVVKFFWSPYPHAYPFYLGLWLGYVLANNKWHHQVKRWSRFGWTSAILAMASVNFSSYVWMAGMATLQDHQYISTTYNILCTIIWASGFAWMITACHYGCAPTLNRMLSLKIFVLLSKASFIIYLSHMLIIRIYFGLQNSLIEVSLFILTYITVGNTFVSTLLGVFLCITFEGPCMKFQRFVIQKLRPKRRLPSLGSAYISNMQIDRDGNGLEQDKTILNMNSTGVALLK